MPPCNVNWQPFHRTHLRVIKSGGATLYTGQLLVYLCGPLSHLRASLPCSTLDEGALDHFLKRLRHSRCNNPKVIRKKKGKGSCKLRGGELASTIKGRFHAPFYHPTWTVRSQSENTLSNGSRPAFRMIWFGSNMLGPFPSSFNSSKAFKVSMTTF